MGNISGGGGGHRTERGVRGGEVRNVEGECRVRSEVARDSASRLRTPHALVEQYPGEAPHGREI